MRNGLAWAAMAAGLLATPVGAVSLDGLAWLKGDWIGEGGGAAQGSGGFSFRPELDGRILVRRNVADYPAQDGKPPAHHEDLMVVFAEGDRLKAEYWDTEGHLIHYDVDAAPDRVVFLSQEAPGPLYRLSYSRTAAGLAGDFEIAPPNDHAHFQPYLAWTARRAK